MSARPGWTEGETGLRQSILQSFICGVVTDYRLSEASIMLYGLRKSRSQWLPTFSITDHQSSTQISPVPPTNKNAVRRGKGVGGAGEGGGERGGGVRERLGGNGRKEGGEGEIGEGQRVERRRAKGEFGEKGWNTETRCPCAIELLYLCTHNVSEILADWQSSQIQLTSTSCTQFKLVRWAHESEFYS